jgi:hypothetical protein
MSAPLAVMAEHGKLWSLWDMLDQYALRIAKAFTASDSAKVMCLPIQIPEGEREPTNKEIALALAYALDLTHEACTTCRIANVIPELDRLHILIGPNSFAPRLGISRAIIHLQSRIKDELEAQHFFRIRPQDVRIYGKGELPRGEGILERVTRDRVRKRRGWSCSLYKYSIQTFKSRIT